ncbi:hypothetical protein F4802DRAFT_542633 [Xylaria palmicola]|nr:hypothetical protein F4802DRAFT_542633 [Xylaria palmicola]
MVPFPAGLNGLSGLANTANSFRCFPIRGVNSWPHLLQNPAIADVLCFCRFHEQTERNPYGPAIEALSGEIALQLSFEPAAGNPAFKISNNIGKNTGDLPKVVEVKKLLGYVEKEWRVATKRRDGARAIMLPSLELPTERFVLLYGHA